MQTTVLNSMRVEIHKVRMYNAATDEWIISRRMATPSGAARMHGEIIPGTKVLVNSDQLEQGMEWTKLDFSPGAN